MTDPVSTEGLRAAIEKNARFQDALDALDTATLWLHRTSDLPHMPSHQAESWERKARSGRVVISAAIHPEPHPDSGIDVGRLALTIADALSHYPRWTTHSKQRSALRLADRIAAEYARSTPETSE